MLATGARERFLPFPGWTLPNVMGAGGLEALARSGFPVKGTRVVVAGTGPLLLAVAKYLRGLGANVRLVAEQTGRSTLYRKPRAKRKPAAVWAHVLSAVSNQQSAAPVWLKADR